MSAAVALMLFVASSPTPPEQEPAPFAWTRLADLGDTIPGKLIGLVNNLIPGTLKPKGVSFEAPSTVVLEDLLLLDPEGEPVMRIKRVAADVQVTALLSGDLVLDGLEVVEPQLLLAPKFGKLNLLRALVKEEKSDKKPPDLQVRLENIRVTKAKVRYADGTKVTVLADGIKGTGRAEIFVAQKLALVTINAAHVDSGSIKLEKLDIPFSNIDTRGRLVGKTLELNRVTGKALASPFSANGKVTLKGDFPIRFGGHIDLPADTWPGRLDKPKFKLPTVSTDFGITGQAKNPDIRLDGRFGSFTAEGYTIDRGVFQALVNKDQTEITQADVVCAGSTVALEGTIVHQTRVGNIIARLSALPFRYVAGKRIDPAPRGTLGGTVTLKGPLDFQDDVSVSADLYLRRVVLYDTSLPHPSHLVGNVLVNQKRLRINNSRLTAPGFDAEALGTVRIKAKTLALEFAATVANVAALRDDIPKNVTLGTVTAAGTITQSFDNPVVVGEATVSEVKAAGVPLANVAAKLTVTKSRVIASEITGTAARGPLTANVELGLSGPKDIAGQFTLTRGQLSTITTGKDHKPLPVTGLANVNGTISGTLEALVVSGNLRGNKIVAQDEPLGTVTASYSYADPNVFVQNLKVRGPLLDADGSLLVFRLDRETMQGRVSVSRLSLEHVHALDQVALTGRGRGLVRLQGTFSRPEVFADMDLKDLLFEDTELGHGPVHVTVAPIAKDNDELLVQASLKLWGGAGRFRARAGYAVDRALLNAEARVRGVDVGPWVARAGENVPVVQGELAANVIVRGPVKAPDIWAHAEAPSLTVAPVPPGPIVDDNGRAFSKEVATYKTYGRVLLDATLVQGALDARLCAFPDATRGEVISPCLAGERWWSVVTGPVDLEHSTFDLDVELSAVDDAWAQFVPALAEAELGIGGEVMSNVDVKRRADGTTQVDGFVDVERMDLAAPGAPVVHLSEPAAVRITENDVRLERPARFAVGDRDVAVAGHVDFLNQQLGVSVQGEVALSLLRLFTDEVTNARGTAETQVVVAGPVDKPRYDGCIRPGKGAQLVPRAWGRPLVFDGGSLCLETSRQKAGAHLLVAEQFRAETGEGWVFLDGEVQAEHLFDEKDISLTQWDLRAEGEDLTYEIGRQFATVAFDLSLKGPRTEPVLAGTLRVTEGALRDSFELKNFYLEKETAAPSAPLHERLQPASLENLTFDVDLFVRDLRVRADVSTIRLDSTLRGELTLSDSIRVPQLTGLIEVSEGNVIFPYANFEIEQTEIEFPRRPDGRISPDIFVLARGDLEPPKSGLDTEVPCAMTIDGDLDRMTLNFEVEDATANYDRSTVLRFIVFGTPLSSGAAFQDREAALRAVSTELTAAFTRDLEETVRDQFGTQIQFSLFYEAGQVKGGVRYQLGDRIKFEGETGVSTNANAQNDPTQPTGTGSNARLRLLLVDHFPPWWVGKELAFQGEVQSGSGTSNDQASSDLRLSYRVFEF